MYIIYTQTNMFIFSLYILGRSAKTGTGLYILQIKDDTHTKTGLLQLKYTYFELVAL